MLRTVLYLVIEKSLALIILSELSGPKEAIYASKKALALYFQDIYKYDISISYFKEVLELTRSLDSNNLAEIESCNNLGIALDRNGRSTISIKVQRV
jgi:hypothetical protein